MTTLNSTTFSEQEIRPDHLMDKQKQHYLNDVARLMKLSSEFVISDCPACKNSSYEQVFSKHGMQFTRCHQCRTIFANPRPLQKHVDDYYAFSENYAYFNEFIFPSSAEVRLERIFKPRVALVAELCQKFKVGNDLLVEVGSGFGMFCAEVMRQGLFKKVIGIEPTAELAATCRASGFEVLEKPIEQISPEDIVQGGKPVNVICSFEVIEHILEPEGFIRKCHELLTPGGLLVLTCPNSEGFDIVTLGAASPAVDTEHLNLFNINSLSLLLERCGFTVIDTQTPGKLDCDLVRNRVLSGEFSLDSQPFLKQILIDGFEEYAGAFQQFLIDQRLSSNMLLVARKA